ncbi:MAG: transketolase, partial [Anaerolineaceae bacterium]|nr:transketolase [Anaerolineaceae bacterium]
MKSASFSDKAINAIKFLAVDGVQTAKSGHPGLPMGTAAMAYTIWVKHLNHDPKNPKWSNRDRFILSGGHGSMLLYALLYLTGYDLSLDELKRFRQWGSLTPGHPEFGLTVGVETTTGPLGQGFSNGVGMAIAESHLAAEFNRDGLNIVDHYTYAIVTDGDLMEGITSEAASLAGHLKLGKLIYLYDDNRISIEGSTELAFTEDRGKRFEAYGWHVQYVDDGNDIVAIDDAIVNAKKDNRPSLIICKTIIGFGLPTLAGTKEAHGSPPGWDEINKAKENAGWPIEPTFFVPEDVLSHFRMSVDKGIEVHSVWKDLFYKYKKDHPDLAKEFERRMAGILPENWEKALIEFPADDKGMATRVSSGKAINMLAQVLPELIGGSADLAPSNMTWMRDIPAFSKETPEGRNIHFGVREHGMAAVANGLAIHGGLIPYAATFLVFSDYARGAIRISALSKMGTIWVFTHDSIGVGEDGPTHQPIEQIASLRLIPGLNVIRPADANEVLESWKFAVSHRHEPTALILSRQNLQTFDRHLVAPASGLNKGAYVLKDFGENLPNLLLMATGSELSLAFSAASLLASEGINVRVVSFPCWELFEKQD